VLSLVLRPLYKVYFARVAQQGIVYNAKLGMAGLLCVGVTGFNGYQPRRPQSWAVPIEFHDDVGATLIDTENRACQSWYVTLRPQTNTPSAITSGFGPMPLYRQRRLRYEFKRLVGDSQIFMVIGILRNSPQSAA
jgi:hypothetical protein